MIKIVHGLLLLFGLFNLSYSQSYDNLKEIQSIASNKDFIKLRETIENSSGSDRIIIRSGIICDGKVEEDRLLADISNNQVEYFRLSTKQPGLNIKGEIQNIEREIQLPPESVYIKIKNIYNSSGFFSRVWPEEAKYNRMLSGGNSYELTLLNNAILYKNAPWMEYLKEALLYNYNQSNAKKDSAKAVYYKSEMKKLETILPDLRQNGEYSGQIGDFTIKIKTKNKSILDSVYYENKFGFSGYVKIEFPPELKLTQEFYCDDFFNWTNLKGKNRSFEVSLRESGGNVFLEPKSKYGKYLYAADTFANLFKIPLKSINGIDVNKISPKDFKKITADSEELNVVMQDGSSHKIRKLDLYDKVILKGANRIGISPNIFF
ncbi:unknown [Coraliomargarita sp. CAG:312]|nr:unknown [Coraliomargarita sp. CAG:312]